MEHVCSVDIRKIKTMGALKGAYIHNETIEGRNQAPNVNLNETFHSLLESDLTYEDKWRERIADAEIRSKKKITLRKDAVYAIEIILGLDHETKLDKSFDLEAWEQQSLEWCKKIFGEDNLIGFAVHMDENSPHIHVTIVPINSKNRLNQKEFIGGAGRLHWLQSSYAKALENLGVVRGIINSKSKHQDIQRLYNSLNQVLLDKLPERLPEENENDYYEKIEKSYEDAKLMVLKLRTDISKEIKKSVGFKQRYHRGIAFQDKVKSLFEDDSDDVFSAIENLSNTDLYNALEAYLEEYKKKTQRNSLDEIQEADNIRPEEEDYENNFTTENRENR